MGINYRLNCNFTADGFCDYTNENVLGDVGIDWGTNVSKQFCQLLFGNPVLKKFSFWLY
jgi:hypothetical protein